MNKGELRVLISNPSSIKPKNVFSIDNLYMRSYYQMAPATNGNQIDKQQQQQQQLNPHNKEVKGKGLKNTHVKCLLSQLKQEIGDKKSINNKRSNEGNKEGDLLVFTRNIKGRNREELSRLSRQKYISTEPVNLLDNMLLKEKKEKVVENNTVTVNKPNSNGDLEVKTKTISNKETLLPKKYIFDDIDCKFKVYSAENSNNKTKEHSLNSNINENVNKKIAEMTSIIFSDPGNQRYNSFNSYNDNMSKLSTKDHVFDINTITNTQPPNVIGDAIISKSNNNKKDLIKCISGEVHKPKELSSLSEPISIRSEDNNINNNITKLLNKLPSKSIKKTEAINIKDVKDIIKRGKSNKSLLVSMNDQIIQLNSDREKLEKNVKQKDYMIAKLKKELNTLNSNKDKEIASYVKQIQIHDETIKKLNQQNDRSDCFIKKIIAIVEGDSNKEELNKLLKEYLSNNVINTNK